MHPVYVIGDAGRISYSPRTCFDAAPHGQLSLDSHRHRSDRRITRGGMLDVTTIIIPHPRGVIRHHASGKSHRSPPSSDQCVKDLDSPDVVEQAKTFTKTSWRVCVCVYVCVCVCLPWLFSFFSYENQISLPFFQHPKGRKGPDRRLIREYPNTSSPSFRR